jgi:hypothetical protein
MLERIIVTYGEGDQMEWTDSNVTIACELMVEQVRKGNRPITHLNYVGYTQASDRFFQLTGIKLSKTQIKNKWDKLKTDFTTWQKLKRRQTGTGWSSMFTLLSVMLLRDHLDFSK